MPPESDSVATVRERTRIPEYDIARIVSIAFVVLIHVIAPFVAPEAASRGGVGPVGLLSRELRFAVPLFVMLTGALCWTSPFGGSTEWRGFFTRRFTVVLLPYLAWSAVFAATGTLLGMRTVGSFEELVRHLLLGTTWYHLYFVPIIAGIYLFAPLGQLLYRRTPVGLVIAATALGVLVPVLISRADPHPVTVFKLVSLIALYLPYAAFGALYSNVRVRSPRAIMIASPLALAAGLGIRAWVTLGDVAPGSAHLSALLNLTMNLLPAFGVLGLASLVAMRWKGIVPRAEAWAACVFGVYLAHPLIILSAEKIAARAGAWPAPVAVWAPVVWSLVTIGSFLAVRVASRTGSLWWLHGIPPRRPHVPTIPHDRAA